MKRRMSLVLGILLTGQVMAAEMEDLLNAVEEAEALYSTIKSRAKFRAELENLRLEFNAAVGAQQALMGLQLIGQLITPISEGTKILGAVAQGLAPIALVGTYAPSAVDITTQIATLPRLASSIAHRAQTDLAAQTGIELVDHVVIGIGSGIDNLLTQQSAKPQLGKAITIAKAVQNVQRIADMLHDPKYQKKIDELVKAFNKSSGQLQMLKSFELVRLIIGPVRDATQALQVFFQALGVVAGKSKSSNLVLGIGTMKDVTGSLYRMSDSVVNIANMSEVALTDAPKKPVPAKRKKRGKAVPQAVLQTQLAPFNF